MIYGSLRGSEHRMSQPFEGMNEMDRSLRTLNTEGEIERK